ncbi:MAG: FecR family protein [Syntrophothermus sp.]
MPFRNRKLDSQFFVRVLKDEVSQEEKEFFDKWLDESDENKEEFSNFILLWDNLGKAPIPILPNKQKQWEKISLFIKENSEKQKSFPILSEQKTSSYLEDEAAIVKAGRYGWIRYAAAIVIIALSISIYFNINHPTSKPFLTENNKQSNLLSLVTRNGEQLSINLSDGSIIELNSDSKLIYPENFNDDKREVELIGEGYFKIKHDPSKPFMVKCGDAITRVTGTEFNIKYRKNDIKVVVSEGKVETFKKNEQNKVKISKGDMAFFTEDGIFRVEKNISLKHHLAWRENILSFQHLKLVDAMEEIRRAFNVEVIFKSEESKNKIITGEFSTQSISQILNVLKLALDINIKKEKNTIIIN